MYFVNVIYPHFWTPRCKVEARVNALPRLSETVSPYGISMLSRLELRPRPNIIPTQHSRRKNTTVWWMNHALVRMTQRKTRGQDKPRKK